MTEQNDWKKAFEEARSQALNVDAYTFQIAWAYAISAPTQGADARPVAWATKLPSGNLSSVRPSLKGAQKRTAAWNERFPNPPHAVTVALCECVTRDAAPSDAQDAARYRWLSKRVVITDGSTPGLMVITVVDDGAETTNEFLDEFTEQAIAASAPMEKT